MPAGDCPGASEAEHEGAHVPEPCVEPVGPAGHRRLHRWRHPPLLPRAHQGRSPGLRCWRCAVEHAHPGDPQRQPVPGSLRQDHRKAGGWWGIGCMG